MCVKLGHLAQGHEITKGTSTCLFTTKDKIQQIPLNQTLMYARIVVGYRPQKGILTV